MAFEAWLLLNL